MSDHDSQRILRVLHLEDSVVDRAVIQEILLAGGVACEFQCADTKVEFEGQLKLIEFDLILSDFTLPAYDGAAALALAQQTQPETPFIFVSGTIGEERAVASLRGGATDYVLKQNLDRLVPAVRRAVREAEEREKRRQAEVALRKAEEKYRTIFENAREGIYQRTPEGHFCRQILRWQESSAFNRRTN